ncbi:MAG UNVERIFIED_CONTAM: hypothetical protein LVT10_05425 [Anaerolineae bacterium]|jgi:hypothetical protein
MNDSNNLPYSLIELQRTNRVFLLIVMTLLLVVVLAWIVGFFTFPLAVKIYSVDSQVVDSRSTVAIFVPADKSKLQAGDVALFQYLDKNGNIESVPSAILEINDLNGEVILKTEFTNQHRYAVENLLHGVVTVVIDQQTPFEAVLQAIG